jgi:hypothetical protein
VPLAVLRWNNQFGHGTANRVTAVVPEQLLGGGIEVDHQSACVHRDDRVQRRVEHGALKFSGRVQAGFCGQQEPLLSRQMPAQFELRDHLSAQDLQRLDLRWGRMPRSRVNDRKRP